MATTSINIHVGFEEEMMDLWSSIFFCCAISISSA